MVNKAIILKKKTIYALSSSVGSHTTDLVLSFINTIKLPVVNLDEIQLISEEKLNTQIVESMKLYDEFINKNMIYDKNKFSYEQIQDVLKNY